ncbi:MAG: ATP-binding protein [Bacteroidales bacterium]|jgi:two-component system NtrC family sensor kinase|nr:ATP-binding protein [Bacteroidales bacterium]
MMRYILLLVFIVSNVQLMGQKGNTNLIRQIDSLKQELVKPQPDSIKAEIHSRITINYMHINPDSSKYYGENAIKFFEKTKNFRQQVFITGHMMETNIKLGNLPMALELGLSILPLIEGRGVYKSGVSPIYDNLGLIYHYLGDNEKSIQYYRMMLIRGDVDIRGVAFGYFGMAVVYESINKLDSALICLDKSHDAFYEGNHSTNYEDINWDKPYQYKVYPAWYNLRAKVYLKQNKPELALADLRETLNTTLNSKEVFHTSNTYNDISALYKTLNKSDSSIYYAEKGIEEANKISYISGILDGSKILAEYYESIDPQKALKYFKLTSETEKKLYGAGNMQVMKDMIAQSDKKQVEIEAAKDKYQNRLRMNAIMGIAFTLLVIAIFLFINSRRKQKAKLKIEKAYDLLKSTQSQLIQSEKMASLGELTAGIAHEIQNPLNFVNNFSEVSVDLVEEMREEMATGNTDEVDVLSNDLKQNLEKISHHGKRASSIVIGMLEHSRASDGKRELTDINTLADEYLRLAYHGLRAKDKSFNADFKTAFDDELPKISVVPQDIGRVLLNLINNAFYACTERSRTSTEQSRTSTERSRSADENDYKPLVSVITLKEEDKIIIKVRDNGNGIPESIKDKIFQPFFTTKPTGQGTGLGLSLSYDIIKAHGGSLELNTEKNVGTEFIITFPYQEITKE